MKIVSLKIANVKRISAVEITPAGDVVKITGRNGQGKSSILDAIEMALAGKSAVCDQPLRRGARSGEVTVGLDDLIVTRTFADDGKTALKVTSRKGAPQKTPQALLDALVASKLAFDPLAFCRMAPKEQAAMLRDLAGLDFTDLEESREALYAERTEINRIAKRADARAKSMPAPTAGLPKELVSVADLVKSRDAAAERNRANAERRQKLAAANARIDEINDMIRALSAERDELAEKVAKVGPAIEALEDADLSEFDQRIAEAEQTNAKIREAADLARIEHERDDALAHAEELTNELEEIDHERQRRIAAANLPVDGLGFDDGQVTLSGLPFSQASQAERIRTAVAIVAASRSELRIALVRDGSLCDSETLGLLAEACAAHDLQLWLEQVSDGAGDGIVIEDGMVKA